MNPTPQRSQRRNSELGREIGRTKDVIAYVGQEVRTNTYAKKEKEAGWQRETDSRQNRVNVHTARVKVHRAFAGR